MYIRMHSNCQARRTALTPRHETALAYAELGIAIFPVAVNGKRPLPGSCSFLDATTSADLINRWWLQADYNLAVEPERMGCFVVDIDPRHGGDETWERLISEYHDRTTTRTVITPSGGRHLWFYGSASPSAGKLGPGLDIRGKASYVLVPPSIIDGVCYRDLHAS
jgi:hypothetical protein